MYICTPFEAITSYFVSSVLFLVRVLARTRFVTLCGVSLPVVEDKNPLDVRRYYELNKKGEVAAAR